MVMKKPQLYIKNEKGRYEPYVEPVADDSNVLYRREGKKYVAHSMTIPMDVLNEGIWVVTKNRHSIRYATADYLRKVFKCERVSDLKDVSVAELGGMDKLAGYLFDRWEEIKGVSLYERCVQIVRILMQYGKEK